MITEKDLQEAIAECEGDRHPNASTCIKLAAFYTILDHLYPSSKSEPEAPQSYSYAPPPGTVENTIEYYSDTDFGRLVHGRDPAEVWPLVDELVSDALPVVNSRLYDGFMRRLK